MGAIHFKNALGSGFNLSAKRIQNYSAVMTKSEKPSCSHTKKKKAINAIKFISFLKPICHNMFLIIFNKNNSESSTCYANVYVNAFV